MQHLTTRRQLMAHLGLSAAIVPFLGNLPSLGMAQNARRKQRMVVMFSPNGIVPKDFWPEEQGADFQLKRILEPLIPFQDRSLILNGIDDNIRGDGDGHMRGIGCLLTGIELFPGNIQGGGHTSAGWASGWSVDQAIKDFLQKDPATRTRFGSLELGVMVEKRADPWTRLSYGGANQPLAPIDDPNQFFYKLYGQQKDQQVLVSVLDDLREDMATLNKALSQEDRQLLEEHADRVRDLEKELKANPIKATDHAVPEIDPNVELDNDNMPMISKLQIDLLVSSFASDAARVATLQYTRSVGQARMRWLGIEDGHHGLSHKPDSDLESQEKLVKINKWYCEQMAYLTKRLSETPEPGADGSLLDHTQVIWTNELGKGNSHTHKNTPFIMTGNGLGFEMGRSLNLGGAHHNRLLVALANGFGLDIKAFGNPDYCADGALALG